MTESTQIAPGVFRTVESNGVLILSGMGCERLLTSLEAAAWDLISRGDSFDHAAAKLAAIGHVALADAECALAGWLRQWTNAGWIRRGNGDG
ncbi:MAG: hypothetical protein WCA13_02350 [Terriglobales bacterium]